MMPALPQKNRRHRRRCSKPPTRLNKFSPDNSPRKSASANRKPIGCAKPIRSAHLTILVEAQQLVERFEAFRILAPRAVEPHRYHAQANGSVHRDHHVGNRPRQAQRGGARRSRAPPRGEAQGAAKDGRAGRRIQPAPRRAALRRGGNRRPAADRAGARTIRWRSRSGRRPSSSAAR